MLTALLPRRVATGASVDGALLAGFSSAEARTDAIARLLPALRARNPAEAQRLLDTYVTDPEQRRRLEQTARPTDLPPTATVIDSATGIVIDSSGSVIYIR